MKKTFRKIVGLATVLAMLVTASAGVMADVAIGQGTATSSDTTVTIPKGITVINPESINVYSPAITYTYSLEPAAAAECGTVPTTNGSRTVQPGESTGATLNTTSLAFASQEVPASPAGVEMTQNLSVTINLTAFSQPGIYRYKITDTTTDATLHAAGLERSADYDTIRFLDVYISRDSSTGDLVVAGYALINGATIQASPDITSTTAKSQGYVSASEQGPGSDNLAMTDTYRTYNLEVTKVVTGGMGDTANQFPFAIAMTDAGTNTHVYVGKGTQQDATEKANAASISTTLANGESYKIYGMSPFALVTVTETNNTNDTYTVTITGSDGAPVNNVNGVAVAAGGTATTAEFQVSTYDSSDTAFHGTSTAAAADTLTVTNNLESISPTGVLIRSLPYVALLVVAGAMLVALKMLNKSEKKEESKVDAK